MDGLLRDELGFRGVSVTDALDMHALAQGAGQLIDAVTALRAGNDLLLCPPDQAVVERLVDGLALAARRGLLDPGLLTASRDRILALRRRLSTGAPPELTVVGSRGHLELADELARRAVTLVRDRDRRLPLGLAPDDRVLAVAPRPVDRTPAESTSTVAPGLATALRTVHPDVTEVVVPDAPTAGDVAAVVEAARRHDVTVVATTGADRVPEQAALVRALHASAVPLVTVAVRTPWDLAAYPEVGTHLCTYDLHPPSLRALAAALVTGDAPGALPVRAGW